MSITESEDGLKSCYLNVHTWEKEKPTQEQFKKGNKYGKFQSRVKFSDPEFGVGIYSR